MLRFLAPMLLRTPISLVRSVTLTSMMFITPTPEASRAMALITKAPIATTLAMEPELMLLDEPTQGMGHEDVDRVTQLIKKVSAGRTILMVEHNMNVVSSIADTITVLQRGAILAEGPYAEVSKDPRVMEAYMGTADAELQGAH